MKKLNIAVIFGGCSPEYSVSLESAHAVITHMDRARYSPVLIGISPKGNWLHSTGASHLLDIPLQPLYVFHRRGGENQAGYLEQP